LKPKSEKPVIVPEPLDLVIEENKSDIHSVLETNPDSKVKAQLEKERRTVV
jgi:hypothetical protein